MPITKSAKKALRQNKKRKVRNLRKKKTTKGLIKEIKELTNEGKAKEAKALLSKTYKALDKTAKSGIIKKNTASRKKSRITALIKRSEKKQS